MNAYAQVLGMEEDYPLVALASTDEPCSVEESCSGQAWQPTNCDGGPGPICEGCMASLDWVLYVPRPLPV